MKTIHVFDVRGKRPEDAKLSIRKEEIGNPWTIIVSRFMHGPWTEWIDDLPDWYRPDVMVIVHDLADVNALFPRPAVNEAPEHDN